VVHASPDGEIAAPATATTAIGEHSEHDEAEGIPAADEDDDDVPAAVVHDDEEA
jgi:hypothetical protein